MLIEKVEVKQIPGSCEGDGQTVSIQATLPADISAVYPYVNARLPGCHYNHAGRVLDWREGSHKIVLRAGELAISNLPTWAEATAAVTRLVEYLNETWQNRHEIVPEEAAHPQATPLVVYKLLPNTNCRACGESSCYPFALKLMARQVSLDACPPLLEPEHEEQLAELGTLFVPPPVVLFTLANKSRFEW